MIDELAGLQLLPPMSERDREKGLGLTLVLDLDETLVHYNSKKRAYLVRPGCIWFLEELSQFYEIVIFTASLSRPADLILNKLDPNKSLISHRLYRQHTKKIHDYKYVKDLSKLGRSLARTLIIDNIEDNFENQPENGIKCHSWIGQEQDRELVKLGNFLSQLALKNP